MRVRTGIRPGEWRDDGPSMPHTFVSGYATRPALAVGSMIPVLTNGANLENRHRRKPPKAFSIHIENAFRLLCGQPTAGTTCARTLGHLDCHRSRSVMDADKDRRQTGAPTGLHR